jgi:hypothetical protein
MIVSGLQISLQAVLLAKINAAPIEIGGPAPEGFRKRIKR